MVVKNAKINVFVNNDLDGLKSLWIDGSSLILFCGEKDNLNAFKRGESTKDCTGLYFLLPDKDDSEYKNSLYIWQTGNVSIRLTNNKSKKDWWQNFIVLTSIDNCLNVNHVKYLEKAFYDLALENPTTINLDNNNIPGGAKIHGSDKPFMDKCIEQTIFILKALNLIDFTATLKEVKSEKKQHKFYVNIGNDLKSELTMTDKKRFLLSKGSYIKANIQESFKEDSYNKTRLKLIEEGKFVPQNGALVAIEEIPFSSASAAASIILGRSANGLIVLKTEEGATLKEFQEIISDAAFIK